MIAVLFSLLMANCHHDEFQRRVALEPPRNTKRRRVANSSNRNPINIHLDYTGFKNKTDTKMCKKVGEVIEWVYSYGNVTCEEVDVVNETQANVTIETLNNVKKFVTSLLNVDSLTSYFSLEPFEDFPIQKKNEKSDLYVCVVIRPFDKRSGIQAGAISYKFTSDFQRPMAGVFFINPAKIPSKPQDIDSIERSFFNTLLHEFCHILGISSSLYKYWREPETMLVYNPFPYKVVRNPKYVGVDLPILHTPNVHNYIRTRFNREFIGNVPNGAEMESDGYEFSSHVSSRVFFTELMGSTDFGKRYISNLTLNMLADTGWYDINFSLAEKYPWGDGSSMMASQILDFQDEAPQKVFPKHYTCSQYENNEQCFYDYSGIARCAKATNMKCDQATQWNREYCSHQSFYNPNGYEYATNSSVVGFQRIKTSTHRWCADLTQVPRKYEKFSDSSYCAIAKVGNETMPGCYEMWCDRYDNLYIKISDRTKRCPNNGGEISIKDAIIKCPPAAHICGLVNTRDDSVLMKFVFFATLILVLLIIILLLSILACYCCCCVKEKSLKEAQTVDIPLVV